MSKLTAYTRVELAEDLRALGAMQIASKADLKCWYDQANSVLVRLSSSVSAELGDIPEFVWHYLADADIRFKDPSYRELQEGQLKNVIEMLEE